MGNAVEYFYELDRRLYNVSNDLRMDQRRLKSLNVAQQQQGHQNHKKQRHKKILTDQRKQQRWKRNFLRELHDYINRNKKS